jgi:hypothetical protein
MFVVKKLIALLVLAGFLVVTFSGCPTPTTPASKLPATGGAGGAGAGTGGGGSAK